MKRSGNIPEVKSPLSVCTVQQYNVTNQTSKEHPQGPPQVGRYPGAPHLQLLRGEVWRSGSQLVGQRLHVPGGPDPQQVGEGVPQRGGGHGGHTELHS